ncbi:hypothetical protein CTAYLR_007310 [Chrysophaeum taylorii]|uniref:glycerol kinase n=1 Tax=Chrysophaeum taylorii TaxID=2483200 RepID=A0AAD7UI52_9STRA|nr:hypothetical protein CTAYLR_007310 [Chrysophaeum taylorii]
MLVGALDQGTSSTRFILFDESSGDIVAKVQKEHTQYHPEPGWVEHDAEEIWGACEHCISGALAMVPDGAKIRAIGITNQRETTLVFDKRTGQAACRAVSWNCTRTVGIAAAYRSERSKRLTGLPVASYFSATKLRWLFDKSPELREDENLVFGTMDTFLLFRLTGVFATDATNASRTLLCNVRTLEWDDELLKYWDVPRRMLARIEPSIGGDFGTVTSGPLAGVPVLCVLGDQSAASVGQCCFEKGSVKATFGTGAFVMLNTGPNPEFSGGLLTTPLFWRKGEAPVYALEGAIAVAGTAIQWLRDNLELGSTAEIAAMAETVPDSAGVVFVPSFNGLFAPHWDSTARGAIFGLTSYATKAHLALATLEAVAFQLDELPFRVKLLKVDGGMSQNDQMLQFCADLLGVPTLRPANLETTAAGAAFGAGLAAGVFEDLDDLQAKTWRPDRTFEPRLDDETRRRSRAKWAKAVARAKYWEGPPPHNLLFLKIASVAACFGFVAGVLWARRRLFL